MEREGKPSEVIGTMGRSGNLWRGERCPSCGTGPNAEVHCNNDWHWKASVPVAAEAAPRVDPSAEGESEDRDSSATSCQHEPAYDRPARVTDPMGLGRYLYWWTCRLCGLEFTTNPGETEADLMEREGLNETGKVQEWVNAVITLRIPLNLPHHATKTEKLDGAEEAYEELGLPEDYVAEVTWEDAS